MSKKEYAEQIKAHLIKYPASVADVTCVSDEMDETKKTFREVLGELLIEKVTFIPKR